MPDKTTIQFVLTSAITVFTAVAAALTTGCAQTSQVREHEAPVATPPMDGNAETIGFAAMTLNGPTPIVYQSMGEQPGRLDVNRDAPGSVLMVRERQEGEDGKAIERELTMEVSEDGSLTLRREVNRAERVIVDFDPPMIVYPANLATGGSIEQKVRMTVHPLNSPDRVQAQGDATQHLRCEGREKISTPSGEMDTVKLVSTLRADLGGPQVVNETQEWFSHTGGIVAIKRMERTTMLGVRVRANSEWWVISK